MGAAESRDWSVYDHPGLRDSISLPRAAHRRELLLALDGIHCAACVARVEKLLAAHGASGRVNLAAKTAEIAWPADRAPLSSLLRALDDAGYGPRVLAQSAELRQPLAAQRAALIRIGVAAIGAMQVMMLAWPTYTSGHDLEPPVAALLRFAQWLFATPVVIFSGWPFFAGAWRALRALTVSMDVPVALALAVAYGVSAARTASGSGDVYFDTATMFVLLLATGRFFESRTRALASERLRVLAGRQVLTALRRDGPRLQKVPVSALRAGDEIMIAPGEAVPVDGSIAGDADLDEALLTGEARPVHRGTGERALAGSLNAGANPVTLRVDALGDATRLSQITRLLHRAQSERPAFALLSDRIASGFILAVIALALAAAWHWRSSGADTSLSVALAVLVASCPCALALAVPAAYAAATSQLAAEGVLVVRPRSLSRLPQVDTVIFDKTGTLTDAGLEVAQVLPEAGQTARHCLQLAAAIERGVTHPIARAFAAVETPWTATGVGRSGTGVTCEVGGVRTTLRALDGEAAAPPAVVRAQPHLTWLVLRQAATLGYIGLAATTRIEAANVVNDLQQRGLQLHLLSGDAPAPVRHVAGTVGIRALAAQQTPEQKLARLQALQAEGRVVLAVGDGVNDAPLLGAADVAVVMPQGAALAQGSADAILLGDSLRGLPRLLDVGARTRRVIAQNIAWALAYNVAVLPLAAANLLHPWLAALGMSVSSLLVVGNALRVAHFRPAGAAAPAVT